MGWCCWSSARRGGPGACLAPSSPGARGSASGAPTPQLFALSHTPPLHRVLSPGHRDGRGPVPRGLVDARRVARPGNRPPRLWLRRHRQKVARPQVGGLGGAAPHGCWAAPHGCWALLVAAACRATPPSHRPATVSGCIRCARRSQRTPNSTPVPPDAPFSHPGLTRPSTRPLPRFEDYGGPYGLHDTIGCCLDAAAGVVSFTRNGADLGPAFALPKHLVGAVGCGRVEQIVISTALHVTRMR